MMKKKVVERIDVKLAKAQMRFQGLRKPPNNSNVTGKKKNPNDQCSFIQNYRDKISVLLKFGALNFFITS